MEPVLRQRLIGAAALVLLAVMVLPMLLDAPERPLTPADAVPLDIPEAPQISRETREVTLTLPPPVGSETDPLAADPNRVVTVDADAPQREDARPELDAAPAVSASQPESSLTPTANPVAAAKPATSPEVLELPVEDAAPAGNSIIAAPTPGNRFVLNLGSFADAANAAALKKLFAASAIPMYVELISLNGRPAHRLRAGPFASRGAAESARIDLRRADAKVVAEIVALTESELAPAREEPEVSKGFAYQVAAYKSEPEANALRDRIRELGLPAFAARADTENGVLWRVRAGPWLARDAAQAASTTLRDRLNLEGMIVSHP